VGDILVPRVGDGEELHGRHRGISVGGIEQEGMGDRRQRAEDASFVVDAFRPSGLNYDDKGECREREETFHTVRRSHTAGRMRAQTTPANPAVER
jgi:hypothetical protein